MQQWELSNLFIQNFSNSAPIRHAATQVSKIPNAEMEIQFLDFPTIIGLLMTAF